MAEKYQMLSGASAPEPLDLEPIKARFQAAIRGQFNPQMLRAHDIGVLLAEVEHLREVLEIEKRSHSRRDRLQLSGDQIVLNLELEVERLRAELADMVPRDWHGLMAILDYAYPESIIPTAEDAMTRDPLPRIVSLIRHLDKARAELAQLRPAYDDLVHERARRDEQIAAAWLLVEHAALPPSVARKLLDVLAGADA